MTPYDRLPPPQRADLFRAFIRADTPLPDLAERADLSLEDLVAFFDDPRTLATLDGLERIAQRRARIAQALHQPAAIQALRLIIATYISAESEDSLAPETPQRRQLRESARRASTTLLRTPGRSSNSTSSANRQSPAAQAIREPRALQPCSVESAKADLPHDPAALPPSNEQRPASEETGLEWIGEHGCLGVEVGPTPPSPRSCRTPTPRSPAGSSELRPP